MRWLAALFSGLLFAGSFVLADRVHPDKPAGPPLEPREARNYALQLKEIVVLVSQQYIRPIAQAELTAAALKGLYEAAGVPVPATLPGDLAKTDEEERKLYDIMYRARLELGNRPALKGSRAIVVSLEALVRSLDPHCALLTGADLERTRSTVPNHGIGLELLDSSETSPLTIKSVALGGPAQKAGIRPGDRILQIEGVGTSASPADLLSPQRRDPIRLTLDCPGQPTSRRITLRPDHFHRETVLGVRRLNDNSWDYLLDPERRIALVRVTAFDFGTAEELERTLAELRAARVRGLVLDLRWCPGGYLDEARDAADLFLGSYNIAYFLLPAPGNCLPLASIYLFDHRRNATVQYRNGQPDERAAQTDGSFTGFPIVVLVNSETSGGAELVAAVLQDNLRAHVAGERTHGKASVQRVIRLADKDGGLPMAVPLPRAALKLSAGLVLRPSGKNLNRFPDSKPADDWGVHPDPGLEFRISADFSAQLHSWWQLQDLRPGSSRESLRLDDPAADPQGQAALRALLELLK